VAETAHICDLYSPSWVIGIVEKEFTESGNVVRIVRQEIRAQF